MSESPDTLEAACPSRTERTALALGHRAGSAGLILLVLGAAALFGRKPHAPLLLLAFGCGDVALLGAFVSLVLARRASRRGGEALATVIFCAAVCLIALGLLIVSRLRGGD